MTYSQLHAAAIRATQLVGMAQPLDQHEMQRVIAGLARVVEALTAELAERDRQVAAK